MAEKPYDPFDLSTAEKNNEPSQIEAALAGVASGVIKIPEGRRHRSESNSTWLVLGGLRA